MKKLEMIFTAVNEDKPGSKWLSRWNLSWPSYRVWFTSTSKNNISRRQSEAMLSYYMPELMVTYRRMLDLAGGGDLEACFLTQWSPPAYLSGCSIAAVTNDSAMRLVRNYDLAPQLNEGLLMRSCWRNTSVMGMVEFLWGLSDGINAHGLCAALAYGGNQRTAPGFGIALIIRYILETCKTTAEAVTQLGRIPSHMAYNVVVMDNHGVSASIEMKAGGGIRQVWPSIATNHQASPQIVDRYGLTKTFDRRSFLQTLVAEQTNPVKLADIFLKSPLFQSNYSEGFGTLFTAEYDPSALLQTIHWHYAKWRNSLTSFSERSIRINFNNARGQQCDLVEGLIGRVRTSCWRDHVPKQFRHFLYMDGASQ